MRKARANQATLVQTPPPTAGHIDRGASSKLRDTDGAAAWSQANSEERLLLVWKITTGYLQSKKNQKLQQRRASVAAKCVSQHLANMELGGRWGRGPSKPENWAMRIMLFHGSMQLLSSLPIR